MCIRDRTSFNFSKNQTFLMGRTMGSVSYLQILAPELTDRMLADFLDVDDSINVNIHIQSIDQSSAIKMIKSKISDLDKMKDVYKRQVHEGAAVRQMEKRGIQTNIGNLNREIKAANSLMQSIRQLIKNLKGWITVSYTHLDVYKRQAP